MGSCAGCTSIETKYILRKRQINIIFAQRQAESRRCNKLQFKRKQALRKSQTQEMFPTSQSTLSNKLTISYDLSTSRSEVSAHLEDSQILNDENQIRSIFRQFLKKTNHEQFENIVVEYPTEFDIVTRKTLFKCLVYTTAHFQLEVDLHSINIKNIYFFWDNDQLQKLSRWLGLSINSDNTLNYP